MGRLVQSLILFALCAISLCCMCPNVLAASPMLVGAGIADVTGQVTEVGFMGYASLNQKGTGLHFRSRARAFIFVDQRTQARVVYVSMDLCMGFEMLKTFIVEKLESLYGSLYTRENLILSGTHTHSAPGGMGGSVLVDITNFGFSHENFNTAVKGVVNAVVKAHESLKPGRILLAEGELLDASINRSPASYEKNPQAERDQYQYNTDKTMTVLKLVADDNTEIGMISFFAVHPVSMNNTNTLSSGDNKGLASMLFEATKNPNPQLTGKGPFVAAFGQANPGDVSPNLNGPHCPDGSACDYVHSTCGGKTEGCIANGPGADMYESTWLIGSRQFAKAQELYNAATLDVTGNGTVSFRHTYVNMQNVTVDASFSSTNQTEVTCQPAMGYGFAGGTTDGPGAFDFTQGQLSPNPFWAFVSGILSKPTDEQNKCQAPKPILLNVGGIQPKYGGEWTPYILPLQVARVGDLFFVAVPGEFTTMSWRRLKASIQKVLVSNGVWNEGTSRLLICGLSNSYSHYIATYEEYQLQRYEGGSTIYGPHTLAAYQQEYSKLANDLSLNLPTPHGPTPDDLRNRTISFIPGVVVDTVPANTAFGDVQTQPNASYKVGEMVSTVFWCASPRNDPLSDETFLTVEQVLNDGTVNIVADDSAWETRFHWKRDSVSQSLCTIEWIVPQNQQPGTYQIRTFGVWKALTGTLTPFNGVTKTFQVVKAYDFFAEYSVKTKNQ